MSFWAIPKSIAKREDLSLKAKLVASILWTRKNADFISFPSREYIAKSLGISIPSVDRAIKELKEKAGLKIERRGLRKTNVYHFPDWLSELIVSDSSKLMTQDSSGVMTPIVRDNKVRNNKLDEKSSPIKYIFHYFKEKVKEIKGYEPEINWAKDGKLIKQRLKKYSIEEIKEIIDWYLNSKHSEKLGDSLSMSLSANIINLWKSSKVSFSYLNKFYPSYG